jgi:NAD(P) transhydrogenase subunit beta
MPVSAETLIQASYFVTAVLFIMGLKRMSSPRTARSGILWAGAGMLVATLVTLLYPGISTENYPLIIAAIVVGTILAWWSGKRVAMTDMPQMIALYNGMGGGAAAAIAAVELYRGESHGYAVSSLAVLGGIIGAVSFGGSLIAFAISCVSRVPAEPTTVPAMIMAALLSTKPSKPTASPVSAL